MIVLVILLVHVIIHSENMILIQLSFFANGTQKMEKKSVKRIKPSDRERGAFLQFTMLLNSSFMIVISARKRTIRNV